MFKVKAFAEVVVKHEYVNFELTEITRLTNYNEQLSYFRFAKVDQQH